MSSSLFTAILALSVGQPLPPPPVAIVVPAHPNFILPGPYIPYLYPVVPAPVVMAHPNWYPYPGPAWWYRNNISPYNPVYHAPGSLPALPTPKTLYRRLGGEAGIAAVIDDLLVRAIADPKVNFTRKGTPAEWKPTPENVARLKKLLVELIGAATGGPQKYTGRSLRESHQGMKISPAEFDAFAADLKASLDKFKVPADEQEELLQIVGSTAVDIIDKKKN